MTTIDRLLPVEEAGRRYDVSRRTMNRRIADGTISVYKTERDRRMTLVSVDEIERVFAPRVVSTEVEPLSAA